MFQLLGLQTTNVTVVQEGGENRQCFYKVGGGTLEDIKTCGRRDDGVGRRKEKNQTRGRTFPVVSFRFPSSYVHAFEFAAHQVEGQGAVTLQNVRLFQRVVQPVGRVAEGLRYSRYSSRRFVDGGRYPVGRFVQHVGQPVGDEVPLAAELRSLSPLRFFRYDFHGLFRVLVPIIPKRPFRLKRVADDEELTLASSARLLSEHVLDDEGLSETGFPRSWQKSS